MSPYASDGQPVPGTRDPLLKFLGGCAVVAAVVVALFLGCAWYVGRQLTRDPAPGRKQEAFLTGAETRYWCLDVRPDDAGFQELFRQFHAAGEETQAKAFRGTFLESFPVPRRRAELAELAPLKLEGSLFTEPAGWAVRGTFSHQVLRLRAGMRMMRFLVTRDADTATTSDIEGVPVTEVQDDELRFAFANIGNRVLAASDASRIREVLTTSVEAPAPALSTLHRAVTLAGEDAWGFIASGAIGSFDDPLSIGAAVGSFDVAPSDDLLFRIAVSESAAAPERRAFKGSVDECGAVAAAFLPMFDAAAIEIDGGGAQPPLDGARLFTGRVSGLSKRLTGIPKRLGAVVLSPSASPSPPSPPSSGDPRSDTPAAPPREGSPKPPR